MNYQLAMSSYQDSLKVLEADIEHANSLAATVPVGKNGARLQMKLVYNDLAPLFLFLLQWIDCSCSFLIPRYLNLFHILVYKVHSNGRPKLTAHGRKATIREFYGTDLRFSVRQPLWAPRQPQSVDVPRCGVILPSLQRLHSGLGEPDDAEIGYDLSFLGKSKRKEGCKFTNIDLEREGECGICLEHCAKMVLPGCCHSMCIKCYRDWNTKSQSCPFCRGSMKRVNSEDLWVLTGEDDVVDCKTVSEEDLIRFYLFINRLPKNYPDALFLVYYEYTNLI